MFSIIPGSPFPFPHCSVNVTAKCFYKIQKVNASKEGGVTQFLLNDFPLLHQIAVPGFPSIPLASYKP